MSETATGRRVPWITGLLVMGLAALLLVAYLGSDRSPRLERSAIGFDGLPIWLERDAIPTRHFAGGGALSADNVGLRILPLFDDYIGDFALPFQVGDPDPYLTAELRSISRGVVEAKVRTLPTLIVYPKWRDGVRRTGMIHPDFLIFPDRPAQFMSEGFVAEDDAAYRPASPLSLPMLRGAGTDVTTAERIGIPRAYGGGFVEVHAPQWADVPANCTPIVGDTDRALVQSCRWEGWAFWVVSDPDLLNNHGLMHEGNPAFASALVADIAGGGDVLLDYSLQAWIGDSSRIGRSWSDLLRYFQPPFLWLWVAAAFFFLLAFWRGSVRDRPAVNAFGFAHGAARRAVFRSQARLMRHTRRDGALVRALAQARISELCSQLLGRDSRGGDPTERLIAFIVRKNEGVAHELTRVLNDIAALPDRISPEAASVELARLETVYEEVLELA